LWYNLCLPFLREKTLSLIFHWNWGGWHIWAFMHLILYCVNKNYYLLFLCFIKFDKRSLRVLPNKITHISTIKRHFSTVKLKRDDYFLFTFHYINNNKLSFENLKKTLFQVTVMKILYDKLNKSQESQLLCICVTRGNKSQESVVMYLCN
jgi:hypothetical protein